MTTSLWIDRVEGDVAVLISDGGRHTVRVPKALLPAGQGEGAWLTLRLDADPAKTAAVAGNVAATRAKLSSGDDGGDFSL
ncbi:MAG: DUF3006 domain-containing protein [Deltaproteobacteria bacterium]|nr:DUF3006 domain-containing protein [Deltaproteobacteria bacterium]